MARTRWTLSLIFLVSIPILATVITAFRIRDLPKDLKCDNCASDKEKFSLKHVSARPQKDLKNVKQEISQRRNSDKQEEEDDSHEDLIALKLKISKPDKNLNKLDSFRLKNDKSIKGSSNIDKDGDEDDANEKNRKASIIKGDKKKEVLKKNVKFDTKRQGNNNDDDGGDTDNKHTLRSKEPLPKPVNPAIKPSKINDSKKNKNNQDTDNKNDNDDDEDDDDDDEEVSYRIQFTGRGKTEKQSQVKMQPKEKVTAHKTEKKQNSNNDDDDDDDDDDDKEKNISTESKSEKTSINTLKTKQVILENNDHDDEDNDEDDDDDDDDDDDTEENNKKSVKTTTQVETQQKIKLETKPAAKPEAEKTKTPAKKQEEPKKTPDKKPDQQKLKPAQPNRVEDKKDDNKHKEKEKVKPKVPDLKQEKSKHKDENKKSAEKSDSEEKSKENIFDSPEIRTEKYLKHVTEALQRRNLLQSEFEDFYAFLPTFAPNFSRIHNPECRRHGQILLRQLRGTKLWALNMLDATAKFPSGILQGNGIQLGDFDQCLGSRARVQLDSGSVVKVQGKYCLALVDLKAEHPELEIPVHLAQAKNLIRSRIDDPGHFVPRFSTLSWGVCVPSTCDPSDVEVIVKDAIKHYQHTSGVVIRIKVDPDDCHTDDGGDWWDEWLELPTVLTMSLYGAVILLVFLATIQDYLAKRKSAGAEESTAEDEEKPENEPKEADDGEEQKEDDKKETESSESGWLSSFSLYHTMGKLLTPAEDDDISCIHGVRGIATVALLVAHKLLPVALTPYTNRVKITEEASMPWWSWCRAGWMYTDTFLLLSGTLTAHRISASSETSSPRRIMSRYFRLTPALAAVVLFYAFVWDKTSSGPMWGSLVMKNAQACREGWWWNLLYVQNYFSFEEMCAPQSHQLALDMQLTVIGCLLVWIIHLKPSISKVMLITLHAIAAYSRYSTVLEHRLTLLAYHGVSVSQLYRTARLSYTSVLHRSTPYLVGLSLGLALQKPSQHNKLVVIIGWLTSITLWSLVWWAGLDSGSQQYKYSAAFAAQYVSLAPIATAIAVAWVIYAVHNGFGGFLSGVLNSRPLVLISRLSYAMYLCQFIVFFTNAATVRTSKEFTLMSLIDVQEMSAILLSSTILTVTFVLPMQSLQKHITFPFSSKLEESDVADESEKPEGDESENKESDQKEEETEPVVQEEEEEIIEIPPIRSRQQLVAHREILEEIPEVEVEYEAQRDRDDTLDEILEEEEDENVEELAEDEPDELEVIEEEGGEDDFWADRDTDFIPRRSISADNDDELDEWEWTNGQRNNGPQYRSSR